MNVSTRIPTWALLFAALALAAIAGESAAAPPGFDADGWHTWQVQSEDGMQRCCGTWTRGKLTAGGCDLDSGRHIRTCNDLVTTDAVRIYLRSESGRVTDIRVLSPECPVESRYEIHDRGRIDNAESVAWLRPYLRADLGDKTIAAIAAHSGRDAFTALRSLLEDREVDRELREQVLFWLVQSHSDERFAYVETLITGR
jgi:hypothetical protein